MGEIVWLGRYPVKSLQGESLDEARLDESGVEGDRRCALVDRESGLVASAKNPRKWRSLLGLTARYGTDGGVTISGPGGETVRSEDPEADVRLSGLVGRPVRLATTRSGGEALERLTPPTEPGAGTMTRNVLGGVTFVDFAAVHIVTTATLDALGGPDVRRFRPNIVVRMAEPEPFVENTWAGRTMRMGAEASLSLITPTPRCAVPTLAQGDELPDDPAVLRTAARLNRVPVFDLGRLTCVGAYAAVTHPGPIRIGDRIRVAT